MTTTVHIATPEGALPVRVFEAGPTARAGVIVYMDAFGWRDELDGMAARFAREGWTTFLPDLFWRLGTLRFPVPDGPGKLDPAMHEANAATSMEMVARDTAAILAHAATAYPALRAFGAVGYCMGARHALMAASRHPETVKAAAMLHGGKLVTDQPDSPHRLIRHLRSALHVAFATDDETCPPEHQALIAREVAAAGIDARIVTHPAEHGWTFPTRWCHDPVEAERAFADVTALFRRTLR